MRQDQFLNVLDEAVAHELWDAATAHLGRVTELLGTSKALGRVVAEDVRATVDVPAFDRSNMDGFAIQAVDTFGADELEMIRLEVLDVSLGAGQIPPEGLEVRPGTAVPIATGGVVPRGADAVLMVEDTQPDGGEILVSRSVVPGENISFAGSDIGRGEIVVRSGTRLSARETGVLAAVGVARLLTYEVPRVVVMSTGDEIVAPGRALKLGQVYDSNQRIVLDTVAELGAVPVAGGILPDREKPLRRMIETFIEDDEFDMVLLSGGTSKGEGDLNARIIHELAEEDTGDWAGVVAHGVALKPGKPLLLAVLGGKPIVVLPGFPTSAVFTFHEFVAPLIRRMGGDLSAGDSTVSATTPMRIDGAPGRTSYVLVDLVERDNGLSAYPLGAGSGSVTAFGRADGFIRIPATTEYLDEGTVVEVRLIDPNVRPADLVVIGSHCIGLDHLLSRVAEQGHRVKMVPVGSKAGLAALGRGEGDIAGVHLLDEETGEYNTAFLPEGVGLIKGYGRRQGVAYRAEHPEFGGPEEAFLAAVRGSDHRMVNRNRGAGTRVLIDRLLDGARPDGYLHQAHTHHAVAAAVEQGRADWGMTLDSVAEAAGLEFRFIANEEFDLAIPDTRRDRPAVKALIDLLEDDQLRAELRELGFDA